MIQSVTFELKPCVMIVTPPAVTEPVQQSASTNAAKKQRPRVLALNLGPGGAEELAELFDEERG